MKLLTTNRANLVRGILMIVTLSLAVGAYAQPQGIENFYRNAEHYYSEGNYHDALPLYQVLEESYPKVVEYKLKSAICLIEEDKEPSTALGLLEAVKAKKPKTKELNYWFGRAQHLAYKFDDAIALYQQALKSANEEKKKEINQLINQAESGKILVQSPVKVNIVNIDAPVNTEWSEYSPLITSDQSIMIFTYRGKNSTGGLQNQYNEEDPQGTYYEDIISTTNVDGKWSAPQSITEINTKFHDATVSLTPDGQKMLLYKDTEQNSGDIYISELDSNKWSTPVRLPINSEHWEGSACLTPDEQAIIFSSQRPGGYGGIDLWIAYKNKDGNWGEPRNLGETVNTKFDDDGAFMHVDEESFFFSSKGHNSMGGYDIFQTKRKKDSTWTTPRNVGYPINTTGDDAFFIVSGDGNWAYYSSGQAGGKGGKDIYTMNVKDVLDLKNVLLVKGNVYRNDTACQARIKVKFENSKLPKGLYKSNSATGDYKINLPLDHYYVLIYEVDGFAPHIETVDATNIKQYTEKVVDVNFYSNKFRNLLTLNGRILYKEEPETPAKGVTVLLKSKDGKIQKTFRTDETGEFTFTNLPADQLFSLDLDVNDPGLVIDSTIVAIGKALYNSNPKRGISINSVLTEIDGSFKLKMLEGFDFDKLTSNNDGLKGIDEEDDVYMNVLKKHGHKEIPGLTFKVQIGAYNFPDNFETSGVSKLGEISILKLGDGITRFTMGDLNTLKKAEGLRRKCMRKGIDDAFVIFFLNGERKFLHELVQDGVFK